MINLVTTCEPGAATVVGNGKLLELAIDNVISTSMAYAPSKSTVYVTARSGDDGRVVVSIVDDGPLVDDALKDLIIQKDSQTELKSAKGGRYGRGLGLYVAALIARTAGGELTIGESDGHSAFELHLKAEG